MKWVFALFGEEDIPQLLVATGHVKPVITRVFAKGVQAYRSTFLLLGIGFGIVHQLARNALSLKIRVHRQTVDVQVVAVRGLPMDAVV